MTCRDLQWLSVISFLYLTSFVWARNCNVKLKFVFKYPQENSRIKISDSNRWIFNLCVDFYREMNSFRKHWAHRFISWPTRPDGALSLFGHVIISQVSFHACPCFGWEVEKKVPCLLHLLCGITRWCTRRSDEQFVVFSAVLRRRFKLGTQKKLAAVFWVWSAETSWSDLTWHTVWGVSICKYWHI